MKKDLLYIPMEISVIKDMTNRELADYLSTLLDQVEPDVLAFVEFLVTTGGLYVRDGQLYVLEFLLLESGSHKRLQSVVDKVFSAAASSQSQSS